MGRDVAHLRGEVERDREPGLSQSEEVVIAAIGRAGVSKARVLAHGPEARAVHQRVDAAQVGRPTGVLLPPPDQVGARHGDQGSSGVMARRSCPVSTAVPGATGIERTRPVSGATSAFYIFIASTTTSGRPAST